MDNNYYVEKVTPLYVSCKNNHVAMVELLLSTEGIEVNDVSPTPLSVACTEGYLDIVKHLLATKKIDANQSSKALRDASQKGYLDIVKHLLATKNIDVNCCSARNFYFRGRTPLYCASRNGHRDIVEVLLLETKINVNLSRPETKETPLFVACRNSHLEIAKLLLSVNGIVINQTMEVGFCRFAKPLSICTCDDHRCKDNNGVGCCAKEDCEAVVKMLQDKGSYVTLTEEINGLEYAEESEEDEY